MSGATKIDTKTATHVGVINPVYVRLGILARMVQEYGMKNPCRKEICDAAVKDILRQAKRIQNGKPVNLEHSRAFSRFCVLYIMHRMSTPFVFLPIEKEAPQHKTSKSTIVD